MPAGARIGRARKRLERAGRSTPLRLFTFILLALVTCWVGLRHAGQMNLYRDGQVLLAENR